MEETFSFSPSAGLKIENSLGNGSCCLDNLQSAWVRPSSRQPTSKPSLRLLPAQAESISTLNFAARCMRVVARQRVNEIVSDSLLLERARRQIFTLRRRLAEAEAAATITVPPPTPCYSLLPLKKAEPPPASASPPSLPPLLAAETKAEVSAAPDTRSVSSNGNINSGSSTAVENETARSGRERRREKYASLVAIPRGARPQEQPAGETLVGNDINSNTGAPEGADVLAAVEARSRRRRADTATSAIASSETDQQIPAPTDENRSRKQRPTQAQAPALALEGEAKGPPQRLLRAGKGLRDGDVNNGQPRPPSSSPPSGERGVKREGEVVKTKTHLNARRGRDIVVWGKIAATVAAANAAAAAATAVASAISTARGGCSRRASANKRVAQTIASASAVRHGSSRATARSHFRKSRDSSRTTRPARKPPAFRFSYTSVSGTPALPARGADIPAAASTIGATAKGAWHADDERSVATQALIERFSTREEELIGELEAWKAKCKSLEKKDAPPRSIADGRALASHLGVEIGEEKLPETPTWFEAAPTAAMRATPPVPALAQPRRPLQAISGASPAIRMPEGETPDASESSAGSHRLARNGVGTVSVPSSLVPKLDREVDPRRCASSEVYMHMRSRILSCTRASR